MNHKAIRATLLEFLFTDEPGSSNIVCFTDMASTILSEQWYKNRKENFNDAKVKIITSSEIK